jgi:hypothetical protein
MDVFSHCGEVKMHVRTMRNVLFLLQKNLGYFTWRTEFCSTPGQRSLKPTKLGRKLSLYLAKLAYRISDSDFRLCNAALYESLFLEYF